MQLNALNVAFGNIDDIDNNAILLDTVGLIMMLVSLEQHWLGLGLI